MLIPVAETEEVIARYKTSADDMVWARRRGKVEFGFIEAKMVLKFADDPEVPEALAASVQWRRAGNSLPEHWCYSLLYRGERIYAIDVQPGTKHFNSVGKGLLGYKEWIGGIHEHLWKDDDYGYAIPIQVSDDPEVVWKMFQRRANIQEIDFVHPDGNEPELKL